MIVISGALVVLAFILLVLGLFLSNGLGWVYASIGVSIVAGVFLFLGALQRRNELAAEEPALEPEARVTPVYPTRTEAATTVLEAPPRSESSTTPTRGGASVFVVPGRPRYHVASCRFLAGRGDTESLDVDSARTQGYTACGVCRPDEELAAHAEAPLVSVEDDVALAAAAEPGVAPVATRADARAATRARPRTAAPARAAKSAGPSRGATASPRAAAKKTAAASAATATGQVLVIPDRDKFHRGSCRFVNGVAGTVALSKATARRQGYVACGVCKP
ncbi:MAG: hypothetical protein LC640_06065 [Frankia sp.]|nr:hypothetical protein [Frankia sp.]